MAKQLQIYWNRKKKAWQSCWIGLGNWVMELNDKIVIYRTADGQTSIDVKLEDETVWLSANQMANLFDRDEKTIRKHINNVFSEGELEKEKRGCLKFWDNLFAILKDECVSYSHSMVAGGFDEIS